MKSSALDRGMLNGCALRSQFTSFSSFLRTELERLLPEGKLLIGFHMRLGDKALRKEMSHLTEEDVDIRRDDRHFTSIRDIEKAQKEFARLILAIQRKRDLCVIFVGDASSAVGDMAKGLAREGVCTIKSRGVAQHSGAMGGAQGLDEEAQLSLNKTVVDWVLLGFADALFQLTHSSFSKTARAYGLLSTDYCAERGEADGVCDSFANVWCTGVGCDALRDQELRPKRANQTSAASHRKRRSRRHNRRKVKRRNASQAQ